MSCSLPFLPRAAAGRSGHDLANPAQPPSLWGVRRLLSTLFAVVCLVAAACGDDGTTADPSAGPAQTVTFVIPAGTGDAMDAGEPVDILPARIDLSVGDSVEIVNDDERNHIIGPFFVEAGETFNHQFRSTGEFEGECSVHPSGRVVVAVT